MRPDTEMLVLSTHPRRGRRATVRAYSELPETMRLMHEAGFSEFRIRPSRKGDDKRYRPRRNGGSPATAEETPAEAQTDDAATT